MPDLKLALRTLTRTPVVTAVACLSLALGIGANAAIFSLFDQLVLRSLPVRQPERLVNLSAPGPKPGSQSCTNAGSCDDVFSYPMFRDLEAANPELVTLAAHRGFGANLAFRDQTVSSEGMLVSGGYFAALGLQPALGRLLGPEDNRTAGAHPVAVLSHEAWRSRFGASPNVVGEPITVNGQVLTIIGVTPAGFHGTTLGSRPEIYVPIVMREALTPGYKDFENRRNYWAYAFGRLQPGVSLEKAASALNSRYHALLNEVEVPLQEGMSEQTLGQFRERKLLLSAGAEGQSSVHRNARAPLLLLLGATGFVLAIACANVANLLLARGASRAGEMAVRLAVGAGRGQLIGQLLTEAALLALAAGLGGVLVASWTLRLLGTMLPAQAVGTLDLHLDLHILAFTTALALATGLLFGLLPALLSTRPNLTPALKGQAARTGGTTGAARFRNAMVTAQIFLAMALLVTAGLFTKSLANVSRVDLGLRTDHLVAFGISPELNGLDPAKSQELFARLESELAALPGVESVSASMVTLIANNNWNTSVSVEGFDTGPDVEATSAMNEVGTGFFSTLGIPLLAGRDFGSGDILKAPKVAIVNQAFARKFGLGDQVIGKRMGVGRGNAVDLDIEIIGLMADAKYSDVKQPVPAQYFVPYRQDAGVGSLNFYVRTRLDPKHLVNPIGEAVRHLDPTLPVENLQTMEVQVRENIFVDRLIGTLSTAFAVLATLLAAVGLYGVLAYTVAQRTREIGLRMALGADASRVRSMVLRQVALMTLVGGGLGTLAAVGLGRLASSLLYELQGYDPGVLVGAGIVLALVALGAGSIPAGRAARVEPMVALRQD